MGEDNTKHQSANGDGKVVGEAWEIPTKMTAEEYEDLLAQIDELNLEEMSLEWMESARYGDVDVVRALHTKRPVLVEHIGSSGNTALHMAAANGHLETVQLLVHHKHPFRKNDAGNTALHWAASNGRAEVVEFLTSQRGVEIDVLERNAFGRSALTEGFSAQSEGVVKFLLEHDSATEEKLLSTHDDSGNEKHVHSFCDSDSPLLVRELAIPNTDNPFADSEHPDQDTTGFSIWAASLVMARWMGTHNWDNSTVVELGAGCGVPGLNIAKLTPEACHVHLTDLNPVSVENLKHNIDLNKLTNATASRMDWSDRSSWPDCKVDFVIGSDLVYQESLIPLLTNVVHGLLRSGGIFFYVAPETGRAGLEKFIRAMKEKCPGWTERNCPAEFLANPLANKDDEECFLHFQELISLKFKLYEFPVTALTTLD